VSAAHEIGSTPSASPERAALCPEREDKEGFRVVAMGDRAYSARAVEAPPRRGHRRAEPTLRRAARPSWDLHLASAASRQARGYQLNAANHPKRRARPRRGRGTRRPAQPATAVAALATRTTPGGGSWHSATCTTRGECGHCRCHTAQPDVGRAIAGALSGRRDSAVGTRLRARAGVRVVVVPDVVGLGDLHDPRRLPVTAVATQRSRPLGPLSQARSVGVATAR